MHGKSPIGLTPISIFPANLGADLGGRPKAQQLTEFRSTLKGENIMAQKQGGKGKTSSQSDINYGRKPQSKPLESVVFSGQVSANFPKWGIPPVFVISDGVTIDVQARETDAMTTFHERRPGTFTRVVIGGNLPRVIASTYR